LKKQLSKSDILKLNDELSELGLKDFFNKKDRVVIAEIENKRYIIKDSIVCFFYHEEKPVPTLKLLLENQFLKQAIVDMGAIKFVTSGADIMRPGITDIDPTIKKDEIIVVVDQTHKKPLCVAQALFTGEEILKLEQGKVLKNLHWVGDHTWQLLP